MKIYAVSDLHGNLDGLDPCDADLVVIAGDLAPMKGWGVWHVNDQVKWINRKFSAWCEKYPKTEFVVIPGNHDLFAQRDDVPTKVVWPVNVHFIVDRVAEAKTSSPSHSNSTMTLRRKRGRGFTSTESLLSRAQSCSSKSLSVQKGIWQKRPAQQPKGCKGSEAREQHKRRHRLEGTMIQDGDKGGVGQERMETGGR